MYCLLGLLSLDFHVSFYTLTDILEEDNQKNLRDLKYIYDHAQARESKWIFSVDNFYVHVVCVV